MLVLVLLTSVTTLFDNPLRVLGAERRAAHVLRDGRFLREALDDDDD